MRRTAITTLLTLEINELLVKKISGHSDTGKSFYRNVQFNQKFADEQQINAHQKLELQIEQYFILLRTIKRIFEWENIFKMNCISEVYHKFDHYPGGMLMPGRYSSSNYRFGFNGQEQTDEISGEGNHNTALFWEYDTRLSRRWNLDPIDQVNKSNYVCFSNNPILRIDPEGNSDYSVDKEGHIELTLETDDKTHTIYNSDKTQSTIVGLDFFKSKVELTQGKDEKLQEATIIVGKNVDEMEKTYEFLAKNSDVEWQYNKFEGKNRQIATLSTSHTKGTIKTYADMARVLKNKNTGFKLIYDSHSHPALYDKATGYPAYPSGFTAEGQFSSEIGDRQYYQQIKLLYEGDVPMYFNIYIPSKPKLQIYYNDKKFIQFETEY